MVGVIWLQLLALALLALVLLYVRRMDTTLVARGQHVDRIEARLISLEEKIARLVDPDESHPTG